jgi:hypothetical protein
VQFTETLTNLITEVIKRQQEILQMIVGCNCGEPIEEVPVVTTVAPAVALKLNRAAPSVDIPFGTRLTTIIPSVDIKNSSVLSVKPNV